MDEKALVVLMAQAASIAWLAVFGVAAVSQMIRGITHDRGYTVGFFDMGNAVAILTLVLLGMPAKM